MMLKGKTARRFVNRNVWKLATFKLNNNNDSRALYRKRRSLRKVLVALRESGSWKTYHLALGLLTDEY